MSESDEKRRIIIDEDWKSQVEQEKETLKHQEEEPDLDDLQQLPPASFEFLLTSLATQALATLGQIPDPTTNKAIIHFPLAKHHIDMLEMLQEKTKGNLNEQELNVLDQSLHELRMLFVSIQNAVATGQIKAEDPNASPPDSKLEL